MAKDNRIVTIRKLGIKPKKSSRKAVQANTANTLVSKVHPLFLFFFRATLREILAGIW
jgi:hypothetical protein